MFRPDGESKAGRRVRAGDRLGVVDMLGVPHEVVSPVDGILGEQLVEAGEAVEYGQELLVIEFAEAPATDG
jgi:biotin carboxyl carrier protein